jgi:glycosyltransferase involved in cell wall biosynthesis
MNILLVITGLGVGGAERQVIDLADRFNYEGHLVKIAYLVGPVKVRPVSKQITVVSLGASKSALGFVRSVLSLTRLIRNFSPDVVHSHMVHANLLARFSRLLVSYPRLICTAHSNYEGGRVRMALYRATNFLCDEFTNVSHAAVSAFEKKKAASVGRMLMINNGVDIEKFRFSCESRFAIRNELRMGNRHLILAVGRLDESKDYPTLLRSFHALASERQDVMLVIAGDGELRNELEELVHSLGLRGRVQFVGVRNDIAALFSAADTFVLSSAWEGFGLVVAEAMACERTVVLTDCGGPPELLGGCGFVVPIKNSVALTCALQQAIELPAAEAKALGISARERIEKHYSLHSAASCWLRIYSNCDE